MISRVVAFLLLVLMAVSCLSHGMAVVLCRCSGHVYVGSAPISCCDEIQIFGETAADEPGGAVCGEECFVRLATQWHLALAANLRFDAPALVLVAVESFVESQEPLMPPLGVNCRLLPGLSHVKPPSRPRTLLFGSLLI